MKKTLWGYWIGFNRSANEVLYSDFGNNIVRAAALITIGVMAYRTVHSSTEE